MNIVRCFAKMSRPQKAAWMTGLDRLRRMVVGKALVVQVQVLQVIPYSKPLKLPAEGGASQPQGLSFPFSSSCKLYKRDSRFHRKIHPSAL